MFLAVIRNRLGITVNPYNYFVLHRRDRQLAVLSVHNELCRHIVASSIQNLCRAGHLCGVLTSIGALDFSTQAGNGVCHFRTIDILLECGGLKAGNRLFGAIIGFLSIVGLNSDLVLILFSTVSHSQSAFCLGDGVVVSIRAIVQRVGEGILALAHLGQSAGNIVGCAFALCKTVATYSDFMLRQRSTIVHLVGTCRCQGDSTLVDRQLAVLSFHIELCRHIVASSIQNLCRAGHLCGVLTSIGALDFSTQAGNGVCHFRTIDILLECGGLKAGNRLFGAIIGFLSIVGLNSDLVLILFSTVSHSQSAFCLGDGVVVSIRAIVQRVGEGILALAHLGQSAGNIVGCAFALCKAFATYSDFLFRQRSTIVHLISIRRCQGDAALGDRQSAVLSFRNNVVVIGTDFTNKLVGIVKCYLVGTGICAGAAGGNACERCRIFTCRITRNFFRLAIIDIGLFVTVGGKRDILVVVEDNDIITRTDRAGLSMIVSRFDGIAFNLLGRYRIGCCAKGHVSFTLERVKYCIAPAIFNPVAQVRALFPCAGESHILGRHGKLAVSYSQALGFFDCPAGEGIAVQRGSSFHNHLIITGCLLATRGRRCIFRDFASILILNLKLALLPLGHQNHIAIRHFDCAVQRIDGVGSLQFPAGEGIAISGRLRLLYGVGIALVQRVVHDRIRRTRPIASIRLICHRMGSSILGIVISVSCHRLARLSEVNMSHFGTRFFLPTNKFVLYFAHRLECRERCCRYTIQIRRMGCAFAVDNITFSA